VAKPSVAVLWLPVLAVVTPTKLILIGLVVLQFWNWLNTLLLLVVAAAVVTVTEIFLLVAVVQVV
jgi:hypothetical protein